MAWPVLNFVYSIFRIMSDNQDYLLNCKYNASVPDEDHLLEQYGLEEEPMKQENVIFLEEVQPAYPS